MDHKGLYLVENLVTDPAYNLALEECLLHWSSRSKCSFVMFWQNRPSVIVGRFQNTAEEVNAELAAAQSIPVIRRMTGGGAVYHDLGNLNYSFIVAQDHLADFDWQALAGPVIKVLRNLGVMLEHSGRNDLTVDGKKISGTAQQAINGALLYHGTLLFDADLGKLSQMLKCQPAKYESKGVKSIRARVANLKQWLPPHFTVGELKAALTLEINAPQKFLTPEETAAVLELKNSKYDTWAWNWGHSPEFEVMKEERFPWGQISLRLNVFEGHIQQAKIFGDFFAPDLSAVEESLIGLAYGQGEYQAALEKLSRLIVGARPADLWGLVKD